MPVRRASLPILQQSKKKGLALLGEMAVFRLPFEVAIYDAAMSACSIKMEWACEVQGQDRGALSLLCEMQYQSLLPDNALRMVLSHVCERGQPP